MARYIDAENFIMHIKKCIEKGGNPAMDKSPITFGTILGLKGALSFAETLPTAEVVEVRHGYWIDKDDKTWCSLCQVSNKQYKPPYCPHCGAFMDGKVTK